MGFFRFVLFHLVPPVPFPNMWVLLQHCTWVICVHKFTTKHSLILV
jgi:hypothetical protein